jgi:hypothetical protein
MPSPLTTTTTAKRLSASCQQIIISELPDDATAKARVVVRSCLADKDLMPLVIHHKCNDCILTPSGLYSDMAVTVARYIYRVYSRRDKRHGNIDGGGGGGGEENGEENGQGNGEENGASEKNGDPDVKISALQVHKPLLVKNLTEINQLYLEIEVQSTAPPPNTAAAAEIRTNIIPSSLELTCTFHSTTPQGLRLQQLGHCTASFSPDPDTWLAAWTHLTPTILNRMAVLRTTAIKANNTQVQLVQRAQAYKLFETFVQYGAKYQNMREVVFDSETLEATAEVDFAGVDPRTERLVGPYYMDGSCHLSGFVCNAVEKDTDRFAYINGGVGAMMLSGKFRPGGGGGGGGGGGAGDVIRSMKAFLPGKRSC